MVNYSEKFIIVNKYSTLFFDLASLGGKSQVVWTKYLKNAKQYDKAESDESRLDLDNCRIHMSEVEFKPIIITIKLEK